LHQLPTYLSLSAIAWQNFHATHTSILNHFATV
jgi:hypothetical protein